MENADQSELEPPEILDVVDQDDNVIGSMTKEEAGTLRARDMVETGRWVRGADILLVNDNGEVWVPTRRDDKKLFPGAVDFSVGGHVSSGEDYLAAALREAQEEVQDITLDPAEASLLFKIRDDRNGCWNSVFIYRLNQTPQFNEKDFKSAEWITPLALLQRLDAGQVSKGVLRTAIEKLASGVSTGGL